MKKYLILGSTSKIACFFIEKIKLSSQIMKISSNKGLDDHYSFNNIMTNIEKFMPDIIINFSNVIDSDYEKSYLVNTLIAKKIFDSLLLLKQFPRVILIGTAAEYGIQEKYSENVITKPCNVYGLTNSMQNQIFNYYTHHYSTINSIYVRPFNIFHEKFDSENLFIGKLNNQLKKMLNSNIKTLDFGNLNVNRDYLLIDDLFEAIIHLIDFGQNGETYNIGMGSSINLKELSTLIRKYVTDKLDHKNLNLDVDFMKGVMPSTENVAIAIWNQLKAHIDELGGQLHCIKLYETENNYVEYFG